jgi:hypothetical protein
MARVYFNGVSRLSFDGTLFSFVLDDTYRLSDGTVHKEKTVELVTDLKAAEGVCKYLLGELEKIKSLQLKQQQNNILDEGNDVTPTEAVSLGKKISSYGDPHSS